MRIRTELMAALRRIREDRTEKRRQSGDYDHPWTDRETADLMGIEYKLLQRVRGGNYLPAYDDCKVFADHLGNSIGTLFEEYELLEQQMLQNAK
jgi:hypothetical protein